jgi:hypothetical protein
MTVEKRIVIYFSLFFPPFLLFAFDVFEGLRFGKLG